jgi:CrcB protein
MNAISRILVVALGGAFGSVFRYLLAAAIPGWIGRIYLWGTFSVNVAGSFLIGIAWAFFERHTLLINWKLFIIIGFLGGFTTYSSFSLEAINLFKSGQWKIAAAYITMTNIAAIAAAFTGYSVIKGWS